MYGIFTYIHPGSPTQMHVYKYQRHIPVPWSVLVTFPDCIWILRSGLQPSFFSPNDRQYHDLVSRHGHQGGASNKGIPSSNKGITTWSSSK